ncbi:hypothetical protein M011DRAFT_456278 [Sporormia fimetaria CBS 119925]|uniref:RTA1-domain-containing protein n=1 Tax=Sporormia fimetaria CBS 119925 TaxID=1340428 RepID=A0A6A6VJT3_9PLEO|nr:hypothetical protein M011DRAFT_456278 [Sporormia fimetaria CBS 119925]
MIDVPQIPGYEHAALAKRAARLTNGFLNPYIYDPNHPLAIVGVIVVPLISAFLVYQYFRYRSWFFWAATIGVLMETVGFVGRVASAYNEHKDPPFLVAFLMILLAPSFLAAACYTAFSRVVWFSCPTHALSFKTLWCFPRWITPTFVTVDLISFLIQLIGGSLISKSYDHDSSRDRTIQTSERKLFSGRLILILGLIIQMSCFASFAVIAVRYAVISRKWREADLGDWAMWRRLSWMINGAACLITLRAVYRIVEIPHDKNTGFKYLQAHEWCFWVFDALPILATLVVFAVWHPGRYLPRTYTGFFLDKRRAIEQKDEIYRPQSFGSNGEELRVFRPEDFGKAPVVNPS